MNKANVIPLQWDTDFFGIACAKVIIDSDKIDFEKFYKDVEPFEFVAIQNPQNDVAINKAIGENTKAYLVDVNIQFEKTIKDLESKNTDLSVFEITPSHNISKHVLEQMEINEDDFQFSKFVLDENLRQRNGYQVYNEWIKNSLKKPNKYFITFTDKDLVRAYILFDISDEVATIELVNVDKEYQGGKIASNMIYAIEMFAYEHGAKKIKVGTQLNNTPAMNLYHYLKFKEVSRVSIFHMWK
jgi:ribosomal protein S18 acetylase RimI-like enzyme